MSEPNKTPSELIVDGIIRDFTDRRGLRQEWEQIDGDIQAEIRQAWTEVAEAVLTNTRPARDDGWTAVEDGLPIVSGSYLVTFAGIPELESGTFVDSCFFDAMNGKWRTNYDNVKSGHAIAWQPLPEPYKGEPNAPKG